MTPLALARRTAFWTLDRMRERRVAGAVADITSLHLDPASAAAVAARHARLTRVLRHAGATTPFYAGHGGGTLASFPVVDKSTFRENGPAMLASGHDRARLHPHRTSGSTGTPFTALWDDRKVVRNQADTIAHAQLAGYRLGSPLYYLRLWEGQYRKGRVRQLLEGVVPVEVRDLDEDRAREVLQLEADEPAPPGHEGRIVVTDLFNRAMPFIRYDTGDIGSLAVDERGEADDTVLATVAGRTLGSLFDTSGRSVNPMAIPELADYDLRQYQLLQTGPGVYTLRLNAEPDSGRDGRIRNEFLSVLGRDAGLTIEYVDEIPPLSSGKRQIVVNQWRPAP